MAKRRDPFGILGGIQAALQKSITAKLSSLADPSLLAPPSLYQVMSGKGNPPGPGDPNYHAYIAAKAQTGDPEAIKAVLEEANKIAKENIEKILGKMNEIGQVLGSLAKTTLGTVKSGRAEDIISGTGRGVRDVGRIFDAAGQPEVGAVFEVAGQVVEGGGMIVGLFRELGSSLQKANLQFSEFSGSMAAVADRQRQREIDLSMQRGERRAGSAEELNQAMNELNKEVALIEDAFFTSLTPFLNYQIEAVTEILSILRRILGIQEGQDDDASGVSLDGWMTDNAREEWVSRFNQPPNWIQGGP